MILNESKLNIEISEGQGFVTKNGEPFVPYVYINCETQRYQLIQPEPNGRNAFIWNYLVAV